ncbi:MAG: sugar ABC transporter permease [Geminicoccaceae bacterium]
MAAGIRQKDSVAPRPGRAGGAVAWRGAGLRRERFHGYLFIAPAFLLLAAIILYPLIHAFQTSLHRTRGLRIDFIGLGNYEKILAEPAFWDSLAISFAFTGIAVALHVALGLALALLLNEVRFLKTAIRIAFLTPWMVAPAIGAIIWMWLLEPQFGVVNYVLRSAGLISEYKIWLGEPALAFGSIVAVDVWRGVPFIMLLMLAGLQGIPREQYEAAEIDGATRPQRFRYVTLPNLRYLLIVASTLDFINTIRHFDIIKVMTQGGPARATEVLPVLLYNRAFLANRFGEAAAIGVALLVIVLALTIVYILLTRPGRASES